MHNVILPSLPVLGKEGGLGPQNKYSCGGEGLPHQGVSKLNHLYKLYLVISKVLEFIKTHHDDVLFAIRGSW